MPLWTSPGRICAPTRLHLWIASEGGHSANRDVCVDSAGRGDGLTLHEEHMRLPALPPEHALSLFADRRGS